MSTVCPLYIYSNFYLSISGSTTEKIQNWTMAIYLRMDDPILFLALELYRLPKALVYLFLAYFVDCKLEKESSFQYLIEFQWLIRVRPAPIPLTVSLFINNDVRCGVCCSVIVWFLFLLLERSRLFYLFIFLLLLFFFIVSFITVVVVCCILNCLSWLIFSFYLTVRLFLHQFFSCSVEVHSFICSWKCAAMRLRTHI